MQAEEKICLYLFGICHALLKGQFPIIFSCQIYRNILIFFQLFLHGFGGNQCHVLLHERVVHAALLIAAMSGIYDDHQLLFRQFPDPVPRCGIFRRRYIFPVSRRFYTRQVVRINAGRNTKKKTDGKKETEHVSCRLIRQRVYAVFLQALPENMFHMLHNLPNLIKRTSRLRKETGPPVLFHPRFIFAVFHRYIRFSSGPGSASPSASLSIFSTSTGRSSARFAFTISL